MKKMLFAFSMAGLFLLSACSRPAAEETETAEMTAAAESTQETSGVLVIEDAGEDKNKTISVRIVEEHRFMKMTSRSRRSSAVEFARFRTLCTRES